MTYTLEEDGMDSKRGHADRLVEALLLQRIEHISNKVKITEISAKSTWARVPGTLTTVCEPTILLLFGEQRTSY